jgi:hypothetical protein
VERGYYGNISRDLIPLFRVAQKPEVSIKQRTSKNGKFVKKYKKL